MHRVELFDKFPADVTLADDVGVMNRAATEDVRSPVWPVVSKVLATRPGAERARRPGRARARRLGRPATRRASTPTTAAKYDDAGPTIMDAVWRPIADAVMRPVYGSLPPTLDSVRGLGGLAGESYVDKDLRTLLQRAGEGPLRPPVLRQGLARRVPGVAVGGHRPGPRRRLVAAQGADPAAWRSNAAAHRVHARA